MAVTWVRGRNAAAPAHRWMLAVALLILAVTGSPAAAGEPTTSAQQEAVTILAVEAGPPVRIVFAAPAGLTTRTLTDDDLRVEIDGTQAPARLQRLSADDLEIAVVLDTTLGDDDLRMLQAAIVELALTLPPGTSMRIVDATGVASEPAVVPGPAIGAIRALQPGSADELAAAVREATALLDASPRGQTALLVVGRDLAARLDPIDDRPLRSLSYLVSVGGDADAATLLGLAAAGRVVGVDTLDGVLAATDGVAQDLRTLYLAEVPSADADARTVALTVRGDESDTPTTTLALDGGAPQPVTTEPAAPARSQPAAPADASSQGGEWVAWLVVAGVLIAVVAAFPLWTRLSRPPVDTLPAPMPVQLPEPPRRRRALEQATQPQRPIAKLAPETRQTLSRAHRGLRMLAVASRQTIGIVPDDMFRLTEARASAALSGHDQPLEVVLISALPDGAARGAADGDSTMIHRAATALLTGWQHTATRQPAPPAVLEINALLRGQTATGTQRSTRPITPVRALNPLVEIGMEHMVLAAQPDDHAALVARAVMVVDIMRAARLVRPLLALSPFLLTDVARYRAACRSEPTDADARDDWLQFFCEGIFERARHAAHQLDRLRRLRTRYRETAADVLAAQLIDLVLAQPVVNAALVRQRLAAPREQARAAIAAAAEVGWLRPHPEHEDLWVADEVIDTFVLEPAVEEPA